MSYIRDKCLDMDFEKKKKEDINVTQVNEALAHYVRDMNPSAVLGLNPGSLTFADLFDNKMLIIHTIRKGIPFELFDAIENSTPFSEAEWAEYLSISTKTLQRNRQAKNFRFKPIHTEKILELAEVTHYGNEVFDTTDQFYTWLSTPSYVFGNLKPSELLKDSYGKEMVMAELTRIDYGIFA